MNLCGFCGFRGMNRGRAPSQRIYRFTWAVPRAPLAQTPPSESTPGIAASPRGQEYESPRLTGP